MVFRLGAVLLDPSAGFSLPVLHGRRFYSLVTVFPASFFASLTFYIFGRGCFFPLSCLLDLLKGPYWEEETGEALTRRRKWNNRVLPLSNLAFWQHKLQGVPPFYMR
jgi:hypothetical protein